MKATFTLVHGGVATLAVLQEPIAIEGREGDAGVRGELAPFKPRADVLLNGHVHAPRGTPTDTLIARARVGTFRKSLSITGDRTWVPSFDGLRPSPAVPFRRMPLAYERAVRVGENAGGIDIVAQGAELGRALANIAAIADQGGETPGFGPLPFAWRARRHGLADAAVMWASRVALSPGPPPSGFDFRIFNAAPTEQQIDEIPAGIDIALENLHPSEPWIETRLPPLRIKLFRRALRAEQTTETSMRGDTLSIDTDRGTCSVIWRAAVPIEGDDASVGRLVIAAEMEGERIGPGHADRLISQLAPQVTYVEAGPAFGLAPHVAQNAAPGQPAAAGPTKSAPPVLPASYPPPRPITQPPGAAASPRPPSDEPRPKTLIPMAAPTVAGALPFRAPPTGFENAQPMLGPRESYPPPPPPTHALTPRPPPPGTLPPAVVAPPAALPPEAPRPAVRTRASPTPPMMPAPVPPRPPSFAPHDEDEKTPPRGYAVVVERTATGTIVPPASTPPPAALRAPSEPEIATPRASGGTIRPPAAERVASGGTIRPPAAERAASGGTIRPPAAERAASGGTIRPPAAEVAAASGSYPAVHAPAFGGRPTPTPPAAVAVASVGLPFAPAPVAMTPQAAPSAAPSVAASMPQTGSYPAPPAPVVASNTAPPPAPVAPSPAPPPPAPEAALGLAGWCAAKVEAWAGVAPLSEILARRGIDEAAFRAFEREQHGLISREAREGRSDHAMAVVEALHAARAAV